MTDHETRIAELERQVAGLLAQHELLRGQVALLQAAQAGEAPAKTVTSVSGEKRKAVKVTIVPGDPPLPPGVRIVPFCGGAGMGVRI